MYVIVSIHAHVFTKFFRISYKYIKRSVEILFESRFSLETILAASIYSVQSV